MKKINMISRIIMTIMTFIIFCIMVINEDSSWFIVSMIFALIVFGLSFPSTFFANKIIEIGNKINNKFIRVLYYIFLPIVLLIICYSIYMIVQFIFDKNYVHSNDMGEALSQGLTTLFIIAVVVIGIILPYIQAIIINILKKIIK